jgi:hypothetical protein
VLSTNVTLEETSTEVQLRLNSCIFEAAFDIMFSKCATLKQNSFTDAASHILKVCVCISCLFTLLVSVMRFFLISLLCDFNSIGVILALLGLVFHNSGHCCCWPLQQIIVSEVASTSRSIRSITFSCRRRSYGSSGKIVAQHPVLPSQHRKLIRARGMMQLHRPC